MSLPVEAVERLFDRILAVYGDEFMRKYSAVPMADVKTAWAHQLAGFGTPSGMKAIAWALDNLPERAPNAIEFRALCRATPYSEPMLALPAPANPAIVQRVARDLEAVRAKLVDDDLGWARKLLGRIKRGYQPTLLQREMVAEAATHLRDEHIGEGA